MKPRLHLLLLTTFAWFGWAAIGGFQGPSQLAYAQSPSGSSRSDNGSPDDRRDRGRGRSGDRSRPDWRGSRSRGEDGRRSDEKRSDDRSSSSTPSTSSSNSSSSSRPTTSSSSTPSSSTGSSSTSGNSSSASGSTASLRAWATKLVKEHDKNGNMILEPEEQGFLGSSAAAEDLNHDGMITIDEIVMHHSGVAAAAVPSSPASTATSTASTSSDSARSSDRDHEQGGYGRHDGGSSSDSRSKTDDPKANRVLTGTAGGTGKDADKRHSYRFSKATDKLPPGLPSWFTARDTNKDGQVSLSEYSHTLSESVVAEFRRYDTNDDGFITAKEAAKQK